MTRGKRGLCAMSVEWGQHHHSLVVGIHAVDVADVVGR